MTPEERFIRIENALATIAEFQARYEGYQARHEEDQARHEKYLKEQEARQLVHDGNLARIEANLERLEVAMETSSHELNLKIGKLTEFQSTLMESQNSAWRAIDRLVRFRGGNGGPQ